jgi:hypothetical protein
MANKNGDLKFVLHKVIRKAETENETVFEKKPNWSSEIELNVILSRIDFPRNSETLLVLTTTGYDFIT